MLSLGDCLAGVPVCMCQCGLDTYTCLSSLVLCVHLPPMQANLFYLPTWNYWYTGVPLAMWAIKKENQLHLMLPRT